MRLLLDTHIVVWSFNETERLNPAEEEALRSTSNRLYVSIATIWEAAIKSALGKLDVPRNLPSLIQSRTELRLLPIEVEHAWRVRQLPHHHRDPFDRLLVAQASIEGLTLMTRDGALSEYGVPIFGQTG
jgi:PIN domain nuclease of toxin-antitoxin system